MEYGNEWRSKAVQDSEDALAQPLHCTGYPTVSRPHSS